MPTSTSSAPPAPSAQAPTANTSQLAPSSDISNDVDQMRQEMEKDKQRQRKEESKKLDELLNKVSTNLEREKEESELDLRQNRDMDNVMGSIHSSFEKLMAL